MDLKIIKIHWLSIAFIILFFLELGWHTFFTNAFGVYFSPIVIFLNGLLLCLVALKINQNNKLQQKKKISTRYKWFAAIVFLVFAIIFFLLYKQSVAKFEINPIYSDIIPTLKNYNQKLLNGEFPYAPIEYPGWTVYPNYLTFQWIPYIIPELLNFDYRWMALFLFYIASLWTFIRFYNPQWSKIETVIKFIYPFFFLWMFKDHHPDVYGYTTELTIAVYYMLFGLSLFTKKWYWIAIGASLCLFSRFSFLFLIPFFLLVFVYQQPWKKTVFLLIGITAIGLVVYILPFLTQDPNIFSNGMAYYAHAAIGEWQAKSNQIYPFHIGRGFGFAVYFYDFFQGDLSERVAACRSWHIGLSILTTGLLMLFFWWKRKSLKEDVFFVLIALKIYFLVFYAFIHVPYLYLQIVPLSISLLIFYRLNLTRQKEATTT